MRVYVAVHLVLTCTVQIQIQKCNTHAHTHSHHSVFSVCDYFVVTDLSSAQMCNPLVNFTIYSLVHKEFSTTTILIAFCSYQILVTFFLC